MLFRLIKTDDHDPGSESEYSDEASGITQPAAWAFFGAVTFFVILMIAGIVWVISHLRWEW